MKRQSLYFITILTALLFLLSSCAATKVGTTTTTTSADINITNTNLSAPDITVWYRQNYFDDVIGPDLPAGDYVLVAYDCGEKGKYQLFNYDKDSESKGSPIEGFEFDACVLENIEDSLISQTQVDPFGSITVTFDEGQIVFMRNVYATAN